MCSSTRRRTSRRCSGACSAGGAGWPAGPSSATLAQSAWPDLAEARRARGRGAARQAGTALPPAHELPELGRNVRVRRTCGDAGPCPTPTCRSRSAARAWRRSIGGREPAAFHGRAGQGGRPTCSGRSTGTVGVIVPADRAAATSRSWLRRPGRRPGYRSWTACGPRGWSTTACSCWPRRRSWPSRRRASGCSTSP